VKFSKTFSAILNNSKTTSLMNIYTNTHQNPFVSLQLYVDPYAEGSYSAANNAMG